jgi:uncharacterized protein
MYGATAKSAHGWPRMKDMHSRDSQRAPWCVQAGYLRHFGSSGIIVWLACARRIPPLKAADPLPAASAQIAQLCVTLAHTPHLPCDTFFVGLHSVFSPCARSSSGEGFQVDITGSYLFPAPREQVWDALLDPEQLQRAIPGCEQVVREGDGVYRLRIAVDIPTVKGIYHGTLRLVDAERPDRYRLIMEGKGARGVLQGNGMLSLEARGPTTNVIYTGQALLGGPLAAVGVQVTGAAGNVMIKGFFTRLADLLAEGEAAAPSAVGATAISGNEPAVAAAPPSAASPSVATPAVGPPAASTPSSAPTSADFAPAAPAASPTDDTPLLATSPPRPNASMSVAGDVRASTRRLDGRAVGMLVAAGIIVVLVVVLILQAAPH